MDKHFHCEIKFMSTASCRRTYNCMFYHSCHRMYSSDRTDSCRRTYSCDSCIDHWVCCFDDPLGNLTDKIDDVCRVVRLLALMCLFRWSITDYLHHFQLEENILLTLYIHCAVLTSIIVVQVVINHNNIW